MSPQLVITLLRWRGRQHLDLLMKERDDGFISGKHLVYSREFVRIDEDDGRKELRNERLAHNLYCTRSSKSSHSYII